MQNCCKSAYLCVGAFPGISGDSLGLLHRCDGLHPHKVREDRYSPSRLEPLCASFVLGVFPKVSGRCRRPQRAKRVRSADPTARNARVTVKMRRL